MYKKIILHFFSIFLLIGCEQETFEINDSITKYAEEKYFKQLKDAQVKFLKCYPEKDGIMRAIYTTDFHDNSFPFVIRFDFDNHDSYTLYFDSSYSRLKKETLLLDIDSCLSAWESLKDAKNTWK